MAGSVNLTFKLSQGQASVSCACVKWKLLNESVIARWFKGRSAERAIGERARARAMRKWYEEALPATKFTARLRLHWRLRRRASVFYPAVYFVLVHCALSARKPSYRSANFGFTPHSARSLRVRPTLLLSCNCRGGSCCYKSFVALHLLRVEWLIFSTFSFFPLSLSPRAG